jgi:hypothetical protein
VRAVCNVVSVVGWIIDRSRVRTQVVSFQMTRCQKGKKVFVGPYFLEKIILGVGLSSPGIALCVVPVFPSVCWLCLPRQGYYV